MENPLVNRFADGQLARILRREKAKDRLNKLGQNFTEGIKRLDTAFVKVVREPFLQVDRVHEVLDRNPQIIEGIKKGAIAAGVSVAIVFASSYSSKK